MKKLAAVLFSLFTTALQAQQNYWQQQVNYKIDVALNDRNHSLKGTVAIEYSNNSPDKLDFIWLHLWPNAYKNENTAFAKQLLRDAEGKKRLQSIQDKGSMDSLHFMANGQKLNIEADPEDIDIIKVLLPTALQPGEKISITTPFFVKLATYNSRSGHDGQSYMICQWYPKPAVYDKKGWHPMPYLDQGEFYSDYGNFDVTITVPSNYIVGSTGTMHNTDELKQYKEIGAKNRQAKSRKNTVAYRASGATKSLHYTAENVHDFAWFADKDFTIRYDTLQMAPGKVTDVFSYHHPDGNKNWVNSTDFIKSAVRFYSTAIGEYAYPVVQAVEGPKNDMSGGMEYPMITLITSPTASAEYLDAVIAHEVGHNWFYGMLGSNERDHAFMDEGINTYYQFRYEAEKYKYNSIFGTQIPEEVRTKPVDQFQSLVYNAFTQIPMEEAIDLPAASFRNKEEYGIMVYIKTALWMYLLETAIGRDQLDKAVRAYFTQWKFKHPYPEDLQAAWEKETAKGFNSFFALLKQKKPFK